MLSAHRMYEQPNHAQGYWNWEDGRGLILDFKDMPVRLLHRHYDVFTAPRLKEDTTVLTAPLSFRTDPLSGEISGFDLKIEPEVEPAFFTRKA